MKRTLLFLPMNFQGISSALHFRIIMGDNEQEASNFFPMTIASLAPESYCPLKAMNILEYPSTLQLRLTHPKKNLH
jgi:hypothetical protein